MKVAGKPGEKKYEDSRADAIKELEDRRKEIEGPKSAEEVVQALHKAKFGHRVGRVLLKDMFTAWEAVPRKHSPQKSQLDHVRRAIKRFTSFCAEKYPLIHEMAGVDGLTAKAFMRAELTERKLAPKTYNLTLTTLRGAFEALRHEAGILNNPFKSVPRRAPDTIHHAPYTREDIDAILSAVATDEIARPLITLGLYTALRRGDCCTIRWEQVDLATGFIRLSTGKTGEPVEIPIFPPLLAELKRAAQAKHGPIYPEIDALYRARPTAIAKILKAAFMRAGFASETELTELNTEREASGLPKIVRRADARQIREGVSKRLINVHGFHSLRSTWITLALQAGVPIELVRRVTGHAAVEIVLKHYFHPDRDAFREKLEQALPEFMGEKRQVTTKADILATLETMTAENLAETRALVIAQLATLRA